MLERIKTVGWNATAMSIILGLSGIIIIVAGIYIEYKYNNAFAAILLSVCTVIGSSTLTASIGTLTIKHTGIMKYIQDKTEDILISDKYIKNLDIHKLKTMRERINARLYNQQIASDKDSLLNYTLKTIDPFLMEYYYEKYSMEIVLRKCRESEDILEKEIVKTIELKPMLGYEESEIQLTDVLRGGIGGRKIQDLDTIEIKKLIIDGNAKSAKIDFFDKTNESGAYRQRYRLVFSEDDKEVIRVSQKGCNIKVHFVTRVSADDRFIFNKISKPCRNYLMRVRYDATQMQVISGHYGFLDNDILRISTGIEQDLIIESDSWVLPGACVMINVNLT